MTPLLDAIIQLFFGHPVLLAFVYFFMASLGLALAWGALRFKGRGESNNLANAVRRPMIAVQALQRRGNEPVELDVDEALWDRLVDHVVNSPASSRKVLSLALARRQTDEVNVVLALAFKGLADEGVDLKSFVSPKVAAQMKKWRRFEPRDVTAQSENVLRSLVEELDVRLWAPPFLSDRECRMLSRVDDAAIASLLTGEELTPSARSLLCFMMPPRRVVGLLKALTPEERAAIEADYWSRLAPAEFGEFAAVFVALQRVSGGRETLELTRVFEAHKLASGIHSGAPDQRVADGRAVSSHARLAYEQPNSLARSTIPRTTASPRRKIFRKTPPLEKLPSSFDDFVGRGVDDGG